jgi:signal transduction histidine kinase
MAFHAPHWNHLLQGGLCWFQYTSPAHQPAGCAVRCDGTFLLKLKEIMNLGTATLIAYAFVSTAAALICVWLSRRASKTLSSRLEESERMKLEFLATISHELKTPLTAIKEGILFLKDNRETIKPVNLDRTLDICLNSTKRLELMIQNLLNQAKMNEGLYEFDDKPKDFAAVVNNAVRNLRPIADRRGQTIEVYTHSTQCWGLFSADGISHAVENIIMNAIKYGDANQPIATSIRRIEGTPLCQLEFKVTNHGKEIPATELNQVFDRFFRGSNVTGQQGVGLGLNLVRRIVEAHHGTISVNSEDGMTSFVIRIPQVNAPEEASA